MAPKTDTKSDAIRLMSTETNFERSGISGQQCRKDAAPRQGEMPAEVHGRLMRDIARDQVAYVVFSYQTVIAWVYRNGAVNLPEIKYSKTTSMQQNWVREAFGDRVNTGIPAEPVDGGDPEVQLSDNEAVILRRMRDEDGTEYEMAWGDVQGDIGGLKSVRFVPSDQVEGLRIKGLVIGRAANAYGAMTSVVLTDKGREVLDFLQPVVRKSLASQYAELGEDDLIDLLIPAPGQAITERKAMEMVAIAQALKARREETAPARRRIGEYLRHQAINEADYQRTKDSPYSSTKEPRDVLDEIRADAYANTARLRLSDLCKVVQPVVRDSEHEFYMQQATLQSGLDTDKLPEKQAALVPCIAKGHVSHYGSDNYSGKNGCTCARPDGRTVNALLNKDFIGIRMGLGYRPSGTLMLIRPKTA